jgi:hypothetical protein
MNCDVLPEECCNQWGFFCVFLGIFVCSQSGYHPKEGGEKVVIVPTKI